MDLELLGMLPAFQSPSRSRVPRKTYQIAPACHVGAARSFPDRLGSSGAAALTPATTHKPPQDWLGTMISPIWRDFAPARALAELMDLAAAAEPEFGDAILHELALFEEVCPKSTHGELPERAQAPLFLLQAFRNANPRSSATDWHEHPEEYLALITRE